MASQSNSCWSLLFFTFPFCLTCKFLLSVHGNSECHRDITATSRGYGQKVNKTFCVRELSCIHSKDNIVISWTPTENNANTMDFLIFLTNVTNVSNVYSVKINKKDFLTIRDSTSTTETLNSSAMSPRIDMNTDYNVTVKRRYNLNAPEYAYASSTACTKVGFTTITSKATNNGVRKQHATNSLVSTSQTTYRQGITKQLTRVSYKTGADYSPATTSQRTSRLVTKQHATNSLVSTSQTSYRKGYTKQFIETSDKTGSNDSPARSAITKVHLTTTTSDVTDKENLYTEEDTGQGTLYTIKGLSVAVLVLLIVIVVIFVKLRKKRQSRNENVRQKEKPRTDFENNGPAGEDTYNHLSRDNQDRNTKMAKQNCYLKGNRADEKYTYSHLSPAHQDRQTKMAKPNNNFNDNKVKKEGIYNHLSRDYQETNTSMTQQGNEEDTYNHLSLSYQGRKTEAIDGNINVISVSLHAPTTLDGDDKNEKSQVKIDTINETGTVAANVSLDQQTTSDCKDTHLAKQEGRSK